MISNAVKAELLKKLTEKYPKLSVKVHTGNPGEEGKSNAATETTRKEVGTWEGTTSLKNKAALKWSNVSTTETYKYVSFWSEATGGEFLGYALLEAEKAVTKGDSAEIPPEGFTWTTA